MSVHQEFMCNHFWKKNFKKAYKNMNDEKWKFKSFNGQDAFYIFYF